MAGSTTLSGKIAAALFAGSAVAVGGGGYLIKDDNGQPMIQSLFNPAPEAPLAPIEKQPKQPEVASVPKQEVQPAPEPTPEVITPQPPEFDVLRVEKDGSVVIAGRALANSKVEIIENGEVLAGANASANGDFAIVFDNPLPAGDHELFIRATPKQGEALLSIESGIVTIPEKGDAGGQVLAMVQKPGQASRIIQAPKPEVKAKPEVKEPEVAALEPAPAQPSPEVDETPEKVEEPLAAVTPESKVEPEPKVEPKPVVPDTQILVQAVDVEPNKLFIAGTGHPNRQARVYIDGQYKGNLKISPQGAFLFELNEGLEAGKHDLRVDMVGAKTAKVSSRASVTIDHVVEPAKTAEVTTPKIEAPTIKAPDAEPQVEVAAVSETKAEPVEEPEVKPQPVEQETASAKPVIQTGRSVIIRRGDNLWRISRRMLGAGRNYTLIFSANADQIKDPNKIYPGQVFDVPDENAGEKSASNTSSDG